MKIYGYTKEGLGTAELKPEELTEVALVATPEELRNVAKFLSAAATSMEELGTAFEHEHLSDVQPAFDGSPGFIVFNPEFSG